MNENKKASSFLEAINKYAQQQSEEIRHEAEQIKQQAVDKATQEGINDAYKFIQKEISTKKAEIVSDIARREQASRKQLFDKRTDILNTVFDEAKDKLIKFTTTEDYKNYITSCVKEIAELFCGKACVVYIKPDDTPLTDMIKAILVNCTVTFDDNIAIGGVKAFCEDMSVFADNTLDRKLQNEKEWFVENSGLKVV